MKVKVIGLGGAGTNIVSVIEGKLQIPSVEFYYANTDNVSLASLNVKGQKILIGERVLQGLGCGADYNLGKKILQEDLDKFSFVEGSDLVITVAGLSKGTGSSIPVLLNYLKDRGILNLSFVIKPFKFEGVKKIEIANQIIKELSQFADSFVVIDNSRFSKGTFKQTLDYINDYIASAISIMLKIIISPLLINLDYNDFKAVIKDGKRCAFAYAVADSVGRDKKILQEILKEKVKKVKTCLIFVQGGADLTTEEVDSIVSGINQSIAPDAFPIFGAHILEEKAPVETVFLGVSRELEID